MRLRLFVITKPWNSEDIFCLFIIFRKKTIVYISGKNGSDENGDGSEGNPFKTLLQVYINNKN